MAYNYVIGPGGQPIILGQVQMMQPLMQVSGAPPQMQQIAGSVPPQQTQVQQPKAPDYMSEEKLQEKGMVNIKLLWCHYSNAFFKI